MLQKLANIWKYNKFRFMASILFKTGLIRIFSLIKSSESELAVAITLNWSRVILWLLWVWDWSHIELNWGDPIAEPERYDSPMCSLTHTVIWIDSRYYTKLITSNFMVIMGLRVISYGVELRWFNCWASTIWFPDVFTDPFSHVTSDLPTHTDWYMSHWNF